MRFSIEISDLHLKTIAADFLAINGYQIWKDRADTLNRQIAQNPFLESHIRNRHRLELRLPEFVNLVRRKPHLSANDIQTFHDVAAFIATVSRLHDHLSEPGKKRLAGMLRDGLQDPNNGLLPLEHEMNTLVHLLSQGYDVTAHDLDHGAGFDYFVTRNGAKLEVECKMVTGDLGRMVPRRHVKKPRIEARTRALTGQTRRILHRRTDTGKVVRQLRTSSIHPRKCSTSTTK